MTAAQAKRYCWIGLVLLLAGCAPKPSYFVDHRPVAPLRVAVLPLANYTEMRDAPARIVPSLAAELGRVAGVQIVEQGAVEDALAKEPWLLLDRIPPDLAIRIGEILSADALLVGSILGGGYRQVDGDLIPHISLSVRLVGLPEGEILWTAVHNRDGADSEWLFGFGRISDYEQLVAKTIKEIVKTFPVPAAPPAPSTTAFNGK